LFARAKNLSVANHERWNRKKPQLFASEIFWEKQKAKKMPLFKNSSAKKNPAAFG